MTKNMDSPNHKQEEFYPVGKKSAFFAVSAIFLFSLVIAYIIHTRKYLTFGVEIDFLGGFLSNAKRLLQGSPLVLKFHPPFYPMALAFFHAFVNDWVRSGFIISWISSIVVLISSYIFFAKQWGKAAGWGCLAGLMSSTIFLTLSSQTGSDLFSFALYASSLLLVLYAIETRSKWIWTSSGLLIGIALLTRTNNIPLLLLVCSPFLQRSRKKEKMQNILFILLGISFPHIIWVIYAIHTGSPVTPTETHLNLALRYFQDTVAHTRKSGDAMIVLRKKFHSTLDVLTYNPMLMMKTYIKDFIYNIPRIFSRNQLIVFPLNLFALPGLILLLGKTKKPFSYLYLFISIGEYGLVTLSPFKYRTLIFLTPLLGAGAGLTISSLYTGLSSKWRLWVATLALLPFFLLGMRETYQSLPPRLHSADSELSDAVPGIKNYVSPDSFIVSLSPHIPFYSGSKRIYFPLSNSLEELRNSLEKEFEGKPIFLYFGSLEQKYRPHISALTFSENNPKWLVPIAESKEKGRWVLYRFIPRGYAP